ncbi:UTRA domain-containing protein [Spirillospora sp. NPDC052269]
MRTDTVRRNTRHVRDGQQVAGGYSFPAAMGNELWVHHISPEIGKAPISDPRLAHMLNVPVDSMVMRRLRVTGPEGEPAFQISTSWIHPRISQEVPEVDDAFGTGPGAWIDAIEAVGHGPLEWLERRRVRMPTTDETKLLLIPADLPIWEIVRTSYSAKDEGRRRHPGHHSRRPCRGGLPTSTRRVRPLAPRHHQPGRPTGGTSRRMMSGLMTRATDLAREVGDTPDR